MNKSNQYTYGETRNSPKVVFEVVFGKLTALPYYLAMSIIENLVVNSCRIPSLTKEP